MWTAFVHWLHHIFNPHCDQCAIEYKCDSCETLRLQLATVNEQNRQLVLSIVELNKPHVETVAAINPTTIKLPNRRHWRARQAELEQASREKAAALRDAPKPDADKEVTVSSLEAELDEVTKLRTQNAKVN